MKTFLDENFLLQSKTAERLYHEFAEKLPIIDYHCHLPVEDIVHDRKFKNLTEAWLEGDHYKWRAMRANGISEEYITGKASAPEKFQKWAETVPYTLRNPLYHWTHLELKRYFGITDLLHPETAGKIYAGANEMLHQEDFRCRGLLKKMKVEVVCTTDDPVDSLRSHQKIKTDDFGVKVLPAFRPDKAMFVEDTAGFNRYLDQLAEVSDVEIDTYDMLLLALQKRHDYFDRVGCRISDHGIETFYAKESSEKEISEIFLRLRSGKRIVPGEALKYKSALLFELSKMDFESGWVQQFHYGALRNNNSFMFSQLGPDTGYDSMGDEPVAKNMSRFLNRLASENKLAKTILYNLNPADNEMVATMAGNFQEGPVPGKIQFGSGWWFLDQKDGIEKQLNTLSNMGLLSRFVGMLTDSRSFLSYPRHEYFRRVLCNLIGQDVEAGLLPNDLSLLGEMVSNISYYNAKKYFNF